MTKYTFLGLLSAITLTMFSQAWAGSTISCPDMSGAKQVMSCSTEDQLKHMFKIGCGIERDPSAKNPDLCDSYAEFKRRKNTALWESADGEFMGYVQCAIPAADVKSAKPVSVAVSQNRGLYKVACNYQGGVKFTFRTPTVCRVPGVKSAGAIMRADCSTDAAACKAICD